MSLNTSHIQIKVAQPGLYYEVSKKRRVCAKLDARAFSALPDKSGNKRIL